WERAVETIRQRSVLQAVLLLILSEHENGLPVEVVYDLIDQNYRFPEEWYRQIPVASGYEELKNQGLLDWRAIPPDRLIEMVATETQWRNEIRWARNDLRKQHFLDMTAPRGTWKLSHAGLQAAQSSITEGLSPEEKKILSNREESRPKRQREPQQPKE